MTMRSEAYFHERVTREMAAALTPAAWTPRQKLALACRILAREGHGSGLAGQVTARAEAPATFWTPRFGLGFDEITASDLLLVDDDLGVLDGAGMASPGARFHLSIYRARPDVRCIVHTHAPHASALSLLGEPLIAAHMDTSPFYEDCAFLADWPGVPIADREGAIIAGALGAKRSILLAHHGLLTTGATIEEAAYLAVLLERAARMQLLARAAGPIRPIPPALGREAHDFMLKDSFVGATFAYFARQILREGTESLA